MFHIQCPRGVYNYHPPKGDVRVVGEKMTLEGKWKNGGKEKTRSNCTVCSVVDGKANESEMKN